MLAILGSFERVVAAIGSAVEASAMSASRQARTPPRMVRERCVFIYVSFSAICWQHTASCTMSRSEETVLLPCCVAHCIRAAFHHEAGQTTASISEARLQEPRLHSAPSNVGRRRL